MCKRLESLRKLFFFSEGFRQVLLNLLVSQNNFFLKAFLAAAIDAPQNLCQKGNEKQLEIRFTDSLQEPYRVGWGVWGVG